MSPRLAIVAGCSGMVGRRLATFLAGREGWDVIGLSRRPAPGAPFRSIEVDLTEPEDCAAKLSGLCQVTHIFYAARYAHATQSPEPIGQNVAMLRNLVETVEPNATRLEHIHLVHGMKVYGCLTGPYKTPAKESDPPTLDENFYYPQQAWIEDRQCGKPWGWTTSRPQLVCEATTATNRNIILTLATYASICRELGTPLIFPGTAENYNAIYQCTHTDILASAAHWVSTNPDSRNNAFNVTNGDYFRWSNLWPRIADWFGLKPGAPRKLPLASLMPPKAAIWTRIVEKHGLCPNPYESMALWPYADFIFAHTWDMMADTTKIRRHGFHQYIDTENMFLASFQHYREQRIIP